MKAVWIVLGSIAAIILLYFIFNAVCALFVDRKKFYDKDSAFYRALLYFPTAVAVFLTGVRLHVTGEEKIPEGRFLLVSNHRSNFDPILTWHYFKKYDLTFISKESNLKVPIFGRIVRRCGFMTIDRENPRKALETINWASDLIKNDTFSVVVYPEGTRSKNCVLLPFHNVVFRIAQRAEVPIVIMTVQGTEKIHKNWFRRHTDVYMDVVGVISAEEAAGMKTNAIGGIVRECFENNLKEINKNEQVPGSVQS